MTGEKYLVFLLKLLTPSIASSEMGECLFEHTIYIIIKFSNVHFKIKKSALYWLCCKKKIFVARKISLYFCKISSTMNVKVSLIYQMPSGDFFQLTFALVFLADFLFWVRLTQGSYKYIFLHNLYCLH